LERDGSSVVGRGLAGYQTCETVESSWLIYLNYMMMHGLANIKSRM
jgi:hypothetical protein